MTMIFETFVEFKSACKTKHTLYQMLIVILHTLICWIVVRFQRQKG